APAAAKANAIENEAWPCSPDRSKAPPTSIAVSGGAQTNAARATSRHTFHHWESGRLGRMPSDAVAARSIANTPRKLIDSQLRLTTRLRQMPKNRRRAPGRQWPRMSYGKV